jgi:hypothetical protein
LWTSPNFLSFLAITCHYIDINWDIKNILLDFVDICGPHTGENIANSFLKSVQDMNILTKVSKINLNIKFRNLKNNYYLF